MMAGCSGMKCGGWNVWKGEGAERWERVVVRVSMVQWSCIRIGGQGCRRTIRDQE